MKFGAQLYTLRDQVRTAEGFRSALERVAAMGYEGVQISAVAAFETEVSPETTKEWLDELGLECCATHRPWERLRDETAKEIQTHQTIGCPLIGVGVAPKFCYEGGEQEWKSWINEVHGLIELLHPFGIDFAFHNHGIDFQRLDGGSKTGFELLIYEADPRLQFILDTYWVVHAGVDVARLIPKLYGRLKVVHLKDKSCHSWDTRMAPVGEGNLVWEAILPALEASGTQWGVVEQDDCYGENPFDCLERSLNYLRSKVN